MSFFRQFPLTTYDLQRTGQHIQITDMFRNVTAPQFKLDSTVAYTDYRIQNGARPDVISQILYGDPDYYWTFFIINDKLKAGHAAWPMSDSQLEAYISKEYDVYSVIQMCDRDDHTINLSAYEYASTTVATDAGNDLDFASSLQYVVDPDTSTSRMVMKYDPNMQQIWLVNSGSTDTFTNILKAAGPFHLSSYASYPFTLSTLTIGSKTYDQFYPVTTATGQKIASPGILQYVPLGRNAIHHYVFAPQIGDYIKIGYDNLGNFYGIIGTVVELFSGGVNSYGYMKLESSNGGSQYHYFTDPRGFFLTTQDVNKVLVSDMTAAFSIAPSNRIIPVTYAEYEYDLNEERSAIRVIHPSYILPFVKKYGDLLNA